MGNWENSIKRWVSNSIKKDRREVGPPVCLGGGFAWGEGDGERNHQKKKAFFKKKNREARSRG